MQRYKGIGWCYCLLTLVVTAHQVCLAQTEPGPPADSAEAPAAFQPEGGAAASNPLAAVNSIDLKWTHTRLTDPNSSRSDLYWIKGSYTFTRWAKLSYEVNYQRTNITGSTRSDWQSVSFKPIFFVKQGELGSGKYRVATGFELILDADNCDKGVGTCTDLISPLLGIAFMPRQGTTIVPLVQHFVELNGRDTSITGARLIAIQRLPKQYWTKLDLIVPYDWNTEQATGTAEIEFGGMLNPGFGIYASAITGIGGHRRFDWGGSVNVRFVF